MAFPTDTAVAAVDQHTAGNIQFALTQTVEVVPQGQVKVLGQSNIGTAEEIIVEVRKRFTRATPGSGAWAEAAL